MANRGQQLSATQSTWLRSNDFEVRAINGGRGFVRYLEPAKGDAVSGPRPRWRVAVTPSIEFAETYSVIVEQESPFAPRFEWAYVSDTKHGLSLRAALKAALAAVAPLRVAA